MRTSDLYCRWHMIILAVVLLLVSSEAGAEVSVALKLDRYEATPADTIVMTVSVTGTRDTASSPVLEGLELFHVSRGGTSSRVEVINGAVNASLEYTYYLQPRHSGTFRIGPASVTVKGKTYTSDTVRLLVTETPKNQGADKGPLFLTSSVTKKKVFIEEQVVYVLKLYRRVNVRDISLSLPEIEHLSFIQLGSPRKYQSTHQGRPYQVLEVRYALVPSRAGTYGIGPARMNMTVLQSAGTSPFGGLFNDPFFSFDRGKPVSVASDALELKVEPLPMEGRPEGFNGLVGQFDMDSSLEPDEVKAGESATLSVRVKGIGNVNLIPDLKLPALNHTKVYADQPALEVMHDEKGITGHKTMKWALVPEKEGRVEIPPLTLTYFDVGAREYRILRTSPYGLSVQPGERTADGVKMPEEKGAAPVPGKEEVEQLGRDILPVHTSMKDFLRPARLRTTGPAFWGLLLFPCLAYGGALGLRRFKRQSALSRSELKSKRAAKTFRKKCSQGSISSRDLILYIRDYLNDRFGLSLGALTPDEAVSILREGGAADDSVEKMRALLQRIEDAVYTGKGHQPCDGLEEIERLVMNIEKELR